MVPVYIADAKQMKILAGQLPYLLQYSSSIAVILV
jgi:hypothetical protein